MSAPLSIRFPMVKEKTGNRRGPRFRRVPDESKLHGAARCAAGMIHCAIRKRELARAPLWCGGNDTARASQRIDRASMRLHSLWARLFARQITQDDPRLALAQAHFKALVDEFCRPSEAAA